MSMKSSILQLSCLLPLFFAFALTVIAVTASLGQSSFTTAATVSALTAIRLRNEPPIQSAENRNRNLLRAPNNQHSTNSG